MKGKIILITGATSGLGKATAIGLAKMGATVVFTARDKNRAETTKKEIIDASGNKKIDYIECDLASFASIRSFCKEYKKRYKKLHVLINNAGVWDFKRKTTIDGIENTLQVNYLAPFLMTNLLLDTIKKSAPSRIINVSSGLHRGTIDFSDIEYRKSFSGIKAYSQSKLALILFTRHLAKKLEKSRVSVNNVHPGFISTDLCRDAGFIAKTFFRLLGKSPKKGAKTTIYLASSPEVETITGEYFVNKKITQSSKESYDMDLAKKLWDVSEKYTQLKKKTRNDKT
ncbi:MAG: SDR family oxidoreductase [archaeon]